eukprot:scaffold3545_cov16-Tisochrysis_lutea.AAC.1
MQCMSSAKRWNTHVTHTTCCLPATCGQIVLVCLHSSDVHLCPGTFLSGHNDPDGVLAWLEERIAAGMFTRAFWEKSRRRNRCTTGEMDLEIAAKEQQRQACPKHCFNELRLLRVEAGLASKGKLISKATLQSFVCRSRPCQGADPGATLFKFWRVMGSNGQRGHMPCNHLLPQTGLLSLAATLIPASHGEPFNVLRYEHNQHYDSHMDTFDPK